MGVSSKRKGYRAEATCVKWLKQLGLDARRVPLSGATSFAKGDVWIDIGGRTLVAEVKMRGKGYEKWYEMVNIYVLRRNGLMFCSQQTFERLLKGEEVTVRDIPYDFSDVLIGWLGNADILFFKQSQRWFLVLFREEVFQTLSGALRR